MDQQRILFHDPPGSYLLPFERFRMEIVCILTIRSLLTKALSSYRRTYKPLSYHIAQDLQKYNIPDYRPRQEQYVATICCLIIDTDSLSGSKRQLRRFVPYSGCGGTVGLPSARRKPLENKIRRSSFGPTTRQNQMRVRQDIKAILCRWTGYNVIYINGYMIFYFLLLIMRC